MHYRTSFLIFKYQGSHKLIAAVDDYLDFPSRYRHYANYLYFIPCPKVSISLILLFEIIIFPVSSLMYLDVTGVNVRPLNPSSGAASAGARKEGSHSTVTALSNWTTIHDR